MKVLVLFLVVGLMVSSCMVGTRGIGEIHGEELRQHIEKGKAIEGQKSRFDYSERSIENHHSIPRQYYDKGSSSSQRDDGGDGESGQP